MFGVPNPWENCVGFGLNLKPQETTTIMGGSNTLLFLSAALGFFRSYSIGLAGGHSSLSPSLPGSFQLDPCGRLIRVQQK